MSASTGPSIALVLWWGEQGYQRARALGLDHQDAADLRQDVIVQLLVRWPAPTKLLHTFRQALRRMRRGLPHARWGTLPFRPAPPARDTLLDAAALVRTLTPGVARDVLAWLDNPDGHEPQVRKRLAQRAGRAIAELRERVMYPGFTTSVAKEHQC